MFFDSRKNLTHAKFFLTHPKISTHLIFCTHENLMDPCHPRYPRHLLDSRLNFMTHINHATHSTHATHEPALPRHPRYLSDSVRWFYNISDRSFFFL